MDPMHLIYKEVKAFYKDKFHFQKHKDVNFSLDLDLIFDNNYFYYKVVFENHFVRTKREI